MFLYIVTNINTNKRRNGFVCCHSPARGAHEIRKKQVNKLWAFGWIKEGRRGPGTKELAQANQWVGKLA